MSNLPTVHVVIPGEPTDLASANPYLPTVNENFNPPQR